MFVKNLIKSSFQKVGLELRKIPFKTNFLIEKSQHVLSIKSSIVDQIFDFFNEVPPFYSDKTIAQLQIAGAWRRDFQDRRKNQLNFLASGDKDAYKNLLNQMLRNELSMGILEVKYYDEKSLGTKVPIQFLKNLEQFLYLTNHKVDMLDDGPFGGRWGVNIDGVLVNLSDPYKGLNAFNSAKIIDYMCNKNPTYIDFGSGLGSDAVKVEKFTTLPLRSILIDIPLNLTTAFAYVSMNTAKKCVLISSVDQLTKQLESNFTESEFLFVPSIFVSEIGKLGINIDLMYNHGSFSEMDYETVKFYLDNLLNGTVKSLFEINSNAPILNYGGHIEVESLNFPIPSEYKLIKRGPSLNAYFNHRNVESLYIYKNKEI